MENCNHLEELLKEQVLIIGRHIEEHKWFQQIENKQKAISDFINKYGWVMREMYCDLCPEGNDCTAYQKYLKRKK